MARSNKCPPLTCCMGPCDQLASLAHLSQAAVQCPIVLFWGFFPEIIDSLLKLQKNVHVKN